MVQRLTRGRSDEVFAAVIHFGIAELTQGTAWPKRFSKTVLHQSTASGQCLANEKLGEQRLPEIAMKLYTIEA